MRRSFTLVCTIDEESYYLLRQMQKIDAGSPFDLVIVANGGEIVLLVLPPRFDSLRARVLNRENTYYNLGGLGIMDGGVSRDTNSSFLSRMNAS